MKINGLSNITYRIDIYRGDDMEDVCVTFTVKTDFGTAAFSSLDQLGATTIKEPLLEHLLAWETILITTATQHLVSQEIGEDNAAKVDVFIQHTQ
jgi:hypothetical protein